jgi:plastocyanin
MLKRVLAVATMSALLLGLAVVPVASAASSHRNVQILDDCDPATFDAALHDPNACVKDGSTTFAEFIAQLQTMGRAPAWHFAPRMMGASSGTTITGHNRGGEFHTFTEVANYGGGCVDVLNQILKLDAVPECANAGALFATTGVAPGGTVSTGRLAAGTHRFECLIHPWMRTTVVVH